MSTLLAIDFDGTFAVQDTIDWISIHYAPEVFAAADAAFSRGEITLDECLSQQVAPITATEREIIDFLLDTVTLRAGIPELLAFCQANDVEPMIVSSGFDNLIEPFLQAQGITLPVIAHTALFTAEGMRISFRGRVICPQCDVACKRDEVRELARGRRIAYVGDGPSDLCAAESADIRFARHTLAEYLLREGYDFIPFEDFHDVRAGLAAALAVSAI